MGLKITKGRVSIVLAFLTDQKSTQIRRLNADLPISVDLTAVKLVAPLPNIVFFPSLIPFRPLSRLGDGCGVFNGGLASVTNGGLDR